MGYTGKAVLRIQFKDAARCAAIFLGKPQVPRLARAQFRALARDDNSKTLKPVPNTEWEKAARRGYFLGKPRSLDPRALSIRALARDDNSKTLKPVQNSG